MRWVHSPPSGRRCCPPPGSIPPCYSINHAGKKKTHADSNYNSGEKKNSIYEMIMNEFSSKLF